MNLKEQFLGEFSKGTRQTYGYALKAFEKKLRCLGIGALKTFEKLGCLAIGALNLRKTKVFSYRGLENLRKTKGPEKPE